MLNYFNSTKQIYNLDQVLQKLNSAQRDLNKLESTVTQYWNAKETEYVLSAIQKRRIEINNAIYEVTRIRRNVQTTIWEVKNKEESKV